MVRGYLRAKIRRKCCKFVVRDFISGKDSSSDLCGIEDSVLRPNSFRADRGSTKEGDVEGCIVGDKEGRGFRTQELEEGGENFIDLRCLADHRICDPGEDCDEGRDFASGIDECLEFSDDDAASNLYRPNLSDLG
ncbi:unannotated protein [freshwater metagenome]|uniref:Unannotated protein n=1 Tax=freshwater metagenome TaxID=449393 RepID=A0A6J6EEE9_9ZZZZ